jgi:hypothetical protein
MRQRKLTFEERFLKFMLYVIIGLICWFVSTSATHWYLGY